MRLATLETADAVPSTSSEVGEPDSPVAPPLDRIACATSPRHVASSEWKSLYCPHIDCLFNSPTLQHHFYIGKHSPRLLPSGKVPLPLAIQNARGRRFYNISLPLYGRKPIVMAVNESYDRSGAILTWRDWMVFVSISLAVFLGGPEAASWCRNVEEILKEKGNKYNPITQN